MRPIKHPTILDVAREAGVSKSLVSRVMQNSPLVSSSSRAAVLSAAKKIGYRPNAAARTIVSRRSNTIGLVVSDFNNPFVSDVIEGVDSAARAGNVRVVMMGGNRHALTERDAIRALLEMRVDGLILACPTLPTRDISSLSTQVPTSIIARTSGSSVIGSVTNDDRLGADLVVQHLIDLGHHRIAHIDGGDVAGARPRREGYRRAMIDRGLQESVRIVHATCTEAGGEAGMRELLEDPNDHPTAVFAANDFAALGALQVLDEMGLRVPEDVSIVGYDNTWLADIHRLDLTTVDQPRREMGIIAAESVLERVIDNTAAVRHEVLQPKLVVRRTTSAPPSRP